MLCAAAHDRNSTEDLAILVADVLGADSPSRQWFPFRNRDRPEMTILQWIGTGFWLQYKRIEAGPLQWSAACLDLDELGRLGRTTLAGRGSLPGVRDRVSVSAAYSHFGGPRSVSIPV